MKTSSVVSEFDEDIHDYEPYEDRKKIKHHASPNSRTREIRNWKKVWIDHASDYEEVDEFYQKS
jgi:hypothetical protein